MSKLYVLDTGALLSNWAHQHMEDSMTTTQSVVDEVKNRPSQIRTELLLLLDKMVIESASQEYLTKTEEAAKKTVDAGKKVGEKGVEVGKDVGKKGLKVGKDVGKEGIKLGKRGVKKTKKTIEDA